MKEDKKKERGEVTRRDFLVGAGAVVVGGAIGAGITYPLVSGDGEVVTTTKVSTVPTTVTTTVGDGATATVTTTVSDGGAVEPASEPEESFVKVLSEHSELSWVDVKNGKIVRIRTVHFNEEYPDNEDINGWTLNARGKTFKPLTKSLPGYLAQSYKKRIYSPNRIRYPLKRVDWDPNGDRNPQNRGNSKFKRISWDEAIDIVASEIQRIHETYGVYGILAMGDGHGEFKNVPRKHGAHKELLDKMGGYTDAVRNADSWEGWYWGQMHILGSAGTRVGLPLGFCLKALSENTEMIVHQGCDWETTAHGMNGHWFSRVHYWFDEIGIKSVYICPDLNYAAAVHASKWIPVLPNTDMALQLAVIYTWINEDLYDKDYVDTHVVGFDEFKAYVMGDTDGVPKTPTWASPKCSVPVWTIKAFAREWASKITSTAHFVGGSFMRGPYSHEPARLETIQLGMQGLGKPGVYQLSEFGPIATPRQQPGRVSLGPVKVARVSDIKQIVSKTLVHHAVLDGHTEQWGTTASSAPVENQFVKYEYPIPAEEGGTEVHMMWIDNPCWTTCWTWGYGHIQAFRNPKIECIVAEHQWLEDDCYFADIILPVSCQIELDDIIASYAGGASYATVSLQKPAIEKIGESMSDYDMCCEIAKKLGSDVYEDYTGGKTVLEWVKSGHEGSNIADAISWEELNNKQYYIPPIAPDWQEDTPQLQGFYEDPENNPVGSPSGLLEFYSERLAENFPDDEERGPYPKWVPGGPGFTHDESLWGERAKDYTMLLISNHPRWREHAQHDDITWLREIMTCKVKGPDGYLYEPVWIHPTDAAARGIENGDIVKLYNERGAVLGGAYVCERILPGAVYQDHGARVDLITDGLDRGGANNLLCPEMGVSKYCWGMATSGFLVELEKVPGEEIDEWRKQYPEAFARDYEPAAGLRFDAWIEGGM